MLASLLALVASPFAALVIDRPITLPAGAVEVDLLGNFSRWSAQSSSASGESAAAGIEWGFAGGAQLGLTVALPIQPGFTFGTLAGSALFAVTSATAIRLDAGYDRISLSGNPADVRTFSQDFLFAGLGVPFKVRLSRDLSLVSGETGAFKVGHFTNVGQDGAALYLGASFTPISPADLVTISKPLSDSNGTIITVNAPVGLLFQAADALAVTLRTGYLAQIFTGGGDTSTLQFAPLHADAVISPAPSMDVGLTFGVAGQVTGERLLAPTGFFDVFDASLWLRLHAW